MYLNDVTNACMFNGINSCSKEFLNATRICCAKHASDIFNLKASVQKLYSSKYELKNIMTTTNENYSSEPIPLIPFPINFKTHAHAGDPYTHNGKKLCIDEGVINSSIQTFIGSKDLTIRGYNSIQQQKIARTLICYISDAGYYNLTNTTDLDTTIAYTYNNFITQNKIRMEKFWSEPESMVEIISESNLISWPVSKLPMFYQGMLMGFELAEHSYALPNNQQGPKLNLIPNCICNADIKIIMTFNHTTDLQIYRNVNDSTYASPLVLTGTIKHGRYSGYSPFQRPMFVHNTTVNLNRVPLCST